MSDVIDLIDEAGWSGTDFEKVTANAFSLSKMTIVDEMEDFDKYNNMKKCEFYEFLGRMAHYLFQEGDTPDDDLPLEKKLEELLKVLLKQFNIEIVFPDFEKDLESDSDQEDDWVE